LLKGEFFVIQLAGKLKQLAQDLGFPQASWRLGTAIASNDQNSPVGRYKIQNFIQWLLGCYYHLLALL
jgi:hypothetical protein